MGKVPLDSTHLITESLLFADGVDDSRRHSTGHAVHIFSWKPNKHGSSITALRVHDRNVDNRFEKRRIRNPPLSAINE